MATTQRRLILGNGEQYIQSVQKTFHSRGSELPRSYSEARDRIKADISSSLELFDALPEVKKIPDEAVLCMRLHPDVTAKTYDPKAIFRQVPDMKSVGSRTYEVDGSTVAQTTRLKKKLSKQDYDSVDGRLVFVQSSKEGFQRFLRNLDRRESDVKADFRDEIRRIEHFNMLSVGEQIVGFEDNWREGRVELVMHPSLDSDDGQMSFLFDLFAESGIDLEKSTIRPYPNGPTFVSCRLNKQSLQSLVGVNPLRSAHPLRFGGLKNLRNAPTAPSPKPPATTTRSTVKVGMFDGGIDPFAPLLHGHAEQDEGMSIGTAPELDGIAHGTAVAGAILHGPLNGYNQKSRLSAPPVFVVSFRVLPTSDPADVDLYESIDVIEQVVPARKDIKVYNLSFGPRGPIEDDPVSRFTYVLDALAVAHKATFCVATGNDGDVEGFERIQAPSDLVHGLGVGAYTFEDDEYVHASYSCQGPGRECGKVKPDVTAFGGCEERPMHLASIAPDQKILDWGTSYASPLATRLTGQAAEAFDRSSALLGRALLVHTALHPAEEPDHYLGHGPIAPDINEVLLCDESSVTVVFQRAIYPKQIVKLPIPWPSDAGIKGKVSVKWTVAALAPVDPSHPGDYTSCCLEDTYYPHAYRYKFHPPKGMGGKSKVLHLIDDASTVKQILKAEWRQADWPETDSGNQYRDEAQRRLDCKWESLVRREKRKYAKGVVEPFLTLRAIGRNGARDPFDYVVVVTVRAEKYEGDIYTAIRNEYPALAPIRLRTEAETRVQIA